MRDRQQLVGAAFVVLGGVVLGLSLRIEPGSPWFYPASLGLSAVWVVGALATGWPRLGPPRPVLAPVLVGAVLIGVFAVGALVVREIDFLDGQARTVADQATHGWWPLLILVTAVTGVAEELFFRGALWEAAPGRRILVTTAAYGVSTLAAGNVLLTFAALVLGAIVGVERRRYDALLPPVLTHCTWSLAMLFVLPALFHG